MNQENGAYKARNSVPRTAPPEYRSQESGQLTERDLSYELKIANSKLKSQNFLFPNYQA